MTTTALTPPDQAGSSPADHGTHHGHSGPSGHSGHSGHSRHSGVGIVVGAAAWTHAP